MVGGDALFLPLCVVASVALAARLARGRRCRSRLLLQVALGLLALPVLGVAGLYRTVVRYIDLRVLVASSAALAAVAW